MAAHWEALEADFASVYRSDLRAALWGPDASGCRRLWSLVRGVAADPGSCTARSVQAARAAAAAPEKVSMRSGVRSLLGRMTGR